MPQRRGVPLFKTFVLWLRVEAIKVQRREIVVVGVEDATQLFVADSTRW